MCSFHWHQGHHKEVFLGSTCLVKVLTSPLKERQSLCSQQSLQYARSTLWILYLGFGKWMVGSFLLRQYYHCFRPTLWELPKFIRACWNPASMCAFSHYYQRKVSALSGLLIHQLFSKLHLYSCSAVNRVSLLLINRTVGHWSRLWSIWSLHFWASLGSFQLWTLASGT